MSGIEPKADTAAHDFMGFDLSSKQSFPYEWGGVGRLSILCGQWITPSRRCLYGQWNASRSLNLLAKIPFHCPYWLEQLDSTYGARRNRARTGESRCQALTAALETNRKNGRKRRKTDRFPPTGAASGQ
jgi:hypothetical protein